VTLWRSTRSSSTSTQRSPDAEGRAEDVSVKAGLVPAIHVLLAEGRKKDMDARDKRGHDDEGDDLISIEHTVDVGSWRTSADLRGAQSPQLSEVLRTCPSNGRHSGARKNRRPTKGAGRSVLLAIMASTLSTRSTGSFAPTAVKALLGART
jgi:hypothetical protein